MVINPSSFIQPATEAQQSFLKVLADLGAPPGALTSKTSPLSVPPLRSGGSVRRWFFRVCTGSSRRSSPRSPTSWTDGLLRHTVSVGLREGKPATDVTCLSKSRSDEWRNLAGCRKPCPRGVVPPTLSLGPFAALQERAYERARSARKRTSAEGVGFSILPQSNVQGHDRSAQI
jgi:hypothetical protein